MSALEFMDAFVLGIVQGITEFLPVSSDGHLVIAQGYFAAFNEKAMTFDIMLHFGTLLAVILYFRRDLLGLVYFLVGKGVPDPDFPARQWFWLIVLATLPTGIVGLALAKPVEPLFTIPGFAAAAITANGILLLSTMMAPKGDRGARDLRISDALLIGFTQGFAILPGISRSSNTIATAMFLGIKGEVAARFSFLISVPAVTGAVLVKSMELQGLPVAALIPYGIGTAVALLTGLWAIAFLLKVIMKGKFQFFGYYCLLFGGGFLLLRMTTL